MAPCAPPPAEALPLLTSPAAGGIHHLREIAEAHGAVLLSPESKASTWDFLRGGLGPDVAYIDRALQASLWLHAAPSAFRASEALAVLCSPPPWSFRAARRLGDMADNNRVRAPGRHML